MTNKNPRLYRGFLVFNVAATYFSTCVLGSIIGLLELNCRVRNGNGCGPPGYSHDEGNKENSNKRSLKEPSWPNAMECY